MISSYRAEKTISCYHRDSGGGTPDMIEKCKEWSIPEPEFEDTGTSMVIAFRRTAFTEELLKQLMLNERQKKAIVYLNEHKKLRAGNTADLLALLRILLVL